ncbi:MAG: right-handed parallel beta-helix repeat-containing protein [Chitinispirillaceae bacterium]|nr:right-handed parallel beta-helix repeat-containing protein [Chitinispirillaceae bacterium]
MKILHSDLDNIWVDPSATVKGNGTFESPYSSIEAALANIKAGQTIILRPGKYSSNLTVQVSGTIHKPIRIMGEPKAEVIISSACWFFYDTSDIIISGLTFQDAPYGAISIMGECCRNRIESIKFINCGTMKKAACTLYIGGAGGKWNVVENCTFIREDISRSTEITPDNASIALMIAQGDILNNAPLSNMIIRRNRFVNYEYGILIGGEDSEKIRCGHIVEYNNIINCHREGILIKTSDTILRGNVIENCDSVALSLQSANECTVENNRIVNCRKGISVHGDGHNITGNCLIQCGEEAISVGKISNSTEESASNCFIENNTIISKVEVNKGAKAAIVVDSMSTGLIRGNLVYGGIKPFDRYITEETKERKGFTSSQGGFILKDNGIAGGGGVIEGFTDVEVLFKDEKKDNYQNSSGFGAKGWVLTPEGFDPEIDNCEGCEGYRHIELFDDDEEHTDEEFLSLLSGEKQMDVLRKFFDLSIPDESEL